MMVEGVGKTVYGHIKPSRQGARRFAATALAKEELVELLVVAAAVLFLYLVSSSSFEA
jgi:hypothetical protein